jgi:hypothetical protein
MVAKGVIWCNGFGTVVINANYGLVFSDKSRMAWKRGMMGEYLLEMLVHCHIRFSKSNRNRPNLNGLSVIMVQAVSQSGATFFGNKALCSARHA